MDNAIVEEKEKIKQQKKEAKIKEFREYLVDKGVVLAYIKILLSLKSVEDRPKKPINAIKDYFGNYRDKSFENSEIIREEIFLLKQQTPKLQEKVDTLEKQLAIEKRKVRVKEIYGQFEADKNGVIGTKQIIEKLSGDKKFTVDEKFTISDFPRVLDAITDNNPTMLDELLNSLDAATKGTPVYKEDLENPLYKKVYGIFKELKKAPGKK